MIIHTDEKNFEKIKTGNKLFLLDVFATWCAPCRMLGDEFKKLENNTDFDIVKIDADENRELAMTLRVQVLPTMFVFKDGAVVERLEGYMTADQIESLMKKHV